jgi:glycosyltransferase involved in cell wall biosynthesis
MDEPVRVLMVTPYPPARDGIAAYALQEVRALRAAGHNVEVLSPYPSAAQRHLDLRGPRGAMALAKRVKSYDKVVVQFHPDVFYPLPKVDRAWALENIALRAPFLWARQIEVRVHEIDYRDGSHDGALGITSRALWRSVDRIVVHTEGERAAFIAAFGVEPSRVTLSAHGANFHRRTTLSRAEARRSLGLPEDVTAFLAIGFIQPHKGFDRAIRAFSGLAEHGSRLDVVGSARLQEPAVQAHVEELQMLAGRTPGVHVHLEYVSDEIFDRWLVASDVVVLPYRSVWSSGVLERAALYRRPVIVTSLEGLAEQSLGRSEVTLVNTDVELAQAMWTSAGVDPAGDGSGPPWPTVGADRSAVQAAVLERAASKRGKDLGTPRAATRSSVTAPSASSPLRALGALGLAEPRSTRPLVGPLKWLIRRITAWEIEPLIARLNALQAATACAVDSASQDGAARAGPSGSDPLPADGSTESHRSAEVGAEGSANLVR